MCGTANLPSFQPGKLVLPSARKKIWVDLDNSPHVPFFRPIIDELRKRNYDVLVTARDAYQVRELLEFYGVSAKLIGRHYGKHKVLKGMGTCWRALAVTAGVRKEKIDLAITHGSRACVIACALLGIPDILLFDYEFTAKIPGDQTNLAHGAGCDRGPPSGKRHANH